MTMSVADARALTDDIKATADQLWLLIAEAHARGAWKALGYGSFRDYVKTEFGMEKSQAYRLLDQARVISALAQASDSPVGDIIITESTARALKPHLQLVVDDVRERVDAGHDGAGAVRDAVEGARRQYVGSRKSVDRSNRIIENIARAAVNVVCGADEQFLNFDALDRSCVDTWVTELNMAADSIRRLAKRLQRHQRRAA